MKVKFEQWQIFVIVAREGSFTMAGRVLGMDPTAIMRRINQLEATLDMQLFVRDKVGIQLTTSGRNLYRKIEPLVRQVETTLQAYHGPLPASSLEKVSCVIEMDLFSFWSGLHGALLRLQDALWRSFSYDIYIRETSMARPRWPSDVWVLRFSTRRPTEGTPFVFSEVPHFIMANSEAFPQAETMGSPADLTRFPILSSIPTQRIAMTQNDVRFPLLVKDSEFVPNLRRLVDRVKRGEGIGMGIPAYLVKEFPPSVRVILADWHMPKQPIYLSTPEQARRHPTLIRFYRMLRDRLTKEMQ